MSMWLATLWMQVTNMTLSKKIDFLEKKFDNLLKALDKDDA